MPTIAEVFKETRQQKSGAWDKESASKLVSFVHFKRLAQTFSALASHFQIPLNSTILNGTNIYRTTYFGSKFLSKHTLIKKMVLLWFRD